MELKEIISNIFTERFGGEGTFYASAGRINLIGEHTDYNGGFVFPGAIDKVIMSVQTAAIRYVCSRSTSTTTRNSD